MISDKKLKKELKIKVSKSPEKYYPISLLKSLGFERKRCKKCGTFFWSMDEKREVCDDPACTGGYKFINQSPAKTKMEFIDVWDNFKKMFKDLGYTPINRYPVVARWRNDIDFVIASIANFQPYVVKGIVEPPANPLVVPQFCLRFPDIDNVGITGRHYTGFVMIGQHAFVPAKDYDQEKYLSDIITWLEKGLRIPLEKIVFHEDAWAGGGNLGPCMEFFSGSLEIGNQVYMMYEVKGSQVRDLPIKVLDMGMGQERCSWITHGKANSYIINMPKAIKIIENMVGVRVEKDIIEKFLPYSGLLNLDEIEDPEKVWRNIADNISIDVETLRAAVIEASSIYAIADHTRTLLFAIGDGALPSNVGGGYNLRVIARRMFDFEKRHNWDLDYLKILESHAKYMKKQYPELLDFCEEVAKIIDIEKKKYKKTREKMRKIIEKLKNKEINEEILFELYESYGISPEFLIEAGLNIRAPENFYKKLNERWERKKANEKVKKEKERAKIKEILDIEKIAPTKEMFYKEPWIKEVECKVLVCKGKYLVLDKTIFYPTGGGQKHDKGWINGIPVVNVFKVENIIVHELKKNVQSEINPGDVVKCKIDVSRRFKLSQMHTAAHILNYACRKILGNHVWQAGAEKDVNYARLDITHYENITSENLEKIEKLANKIIAEDIAITKEVMERTEAEKKYGFRIYQGGFVPGKKIRIVKIDEYDVEACCGTHLDRTGKVGGIKILNSYKIQDSVVRLEFVAGLSLVEKMRELDNIVKSVCDVFNVPKDQVVKTAERFFKEWKAQKKEIEKLKSELSKVEAYKNKEKIGDIKGHIVELIKIKSENIKDVLSACDNLGREDKNKVVVVAGMTKKGCFICIKFPQNHNEIQSLLISKFEKIGIKLKKKDKFLIGGGKINSVDKIKNILIEEC